MTVTPHPGFAHSPDGSDRRSAIPVRTSPPVLWIRQHARGYWVLTGRGDVRRDLLEPLGIPALRSAGPGWRVDALQASDVEAFADHLGWTVRHRQGGRR